MRQRIVITAITALCLSGTAAVAQMPSGKQIPGAGSVPAPPAVPAAPTVPTVPALPTVPPLPTGALSKDALLKQANDMVSNLTSMKNAGNLAPAQLKQVDDMLPKATAIKTELEKPKVEATKLGQLASTLSDLQKQMTALKGLVR